MSFLQYKRTKICIFDFVFWVQFHEFSYQKCKYNRIYLQKIFSFYFLKEMDYNKTKKPFLQQKGQKMRRKDNKMNRAQESEYQLPSSKKGNAKDFFKDLDE